MNRTPSHIGTLKLYEEALTQHSIGLVYSALGEKQKALDYYNQALLLRRVAGDRVGEAATLTNIGVVYDDLGEKQKALDSHNQALPLMRAVGNRAGEAVTLTNIGAVYAGLGEKQKALDYYTQSLPLSRAVQDPLGEASTLTLLMEYWKSLQSPSLAVLFGKQAIESLPAGETQHRRAGKRGPAELPEIEGRLLSRTGGATDFGGTAAGSAAGAGSAEGRGVLGLHATPRRRRL
jgi:tetratricopeptide (TPR) repeat protein